MVYYTGDIHGHEYEIESFCKRFKPTRDDIIVILGDVGANYGKDERDTSTSLTQRPSMSQSRILTKN